MVESKTTLTAKRSVSNRFTNEKRRIKEIQRRKTLQNSYRNSTSKRSSEIDISTVTLTDRPSISKEGPQALKVTTSKMLKESSPLPPIPKHKRVLSQVCEKEEDEIGGE